MGYIEDVAVFTAYIKEKYGREFHIIDKSKKTTDIEDPRLLHWAHVISECLDVDINKLFKKGRENNSYEKIWFRYMIIHNEDITISALARALGVSHATIITSNRRCREWIEVYPEVYDKIIQTGKKHKVIKESNIEIVYKN